MKTLTSAGTAAKRKSQKPKPAKEELLTPAHEEARELCLLAQQIGIAEPWQWMEEIDLFGVQDPVAGEIGFVSVLGMRGEYRAVAVYLGEEALQGWLDFEAALQRYPELPDAAQLLLEIPHVHVYFSPPNQLEKRDRDLLKGVGLKFTGVRPSFRSSRPGYFPWFITRDEARLMVQILSQTIIVAGRFLENPDTLVIEKDDNNLGLLVRVPQETGSERIWEDKIQKFPLRRPEQAMAPVQPAVVTKLKQITQSHLELELDLIMAPAAVGKRSDRPLALFALLLGDHQSGLICGAEFMTAEQGFAAMYADIPTRVAGMLLDAQLLPKRLRIRSAKLFTLLKPLTRELNIELFHTTELPAIDEAADFIFEQMGVQRLTAS